MNDETIINIEINNYTNKLIINEYYDIVPILQESYFDIKNAELLENITDNSTLSIGLTFFNEESIELKRTLISLADGIKEFDNNDYNCVIVGDGYNNMSDSMEIYLKKLFCCNERENILWDNMINNIIEFDKNNVDKTFIIQKVSYDEIRDQYKKNPTQILYNNKKLNLCLILKIKNRRKHNSHQWILSDNGFISQFNPNKSYVLLTDCGSIFKQKSINRMIKYMEKNNNCVGCTGIQQIMTSSEQNMQDNIWSSILRKVQYVDYMLSYYIQLVAFSSVGFLPVLPGPCVMLRVSDLFYKKPIKINPSDDLMEESIDYPNDIIKHETPMTHYFNVINIPTNETNIIIENVKLAEDRIPSYSIITHNRENVYSTWINGAIFKSQSETSIQDILFQRRRWINGSFYCNIWTLFTKPEYILESNIKLFRKIFIFVMLIIQFLNNIFSTLFTAFVTISLYFSMDIIGFKHLYVQIFVVLYNIFVILFCWTHRYIKFVKPLICTFIVLNIVCLVLIFYGYIHKMIFNHVKWIDIFFMCILIFVVLVPFIIVLFSLDFKEFGKLLLYFIPYVLFLPTLLGTFTLYSCARSDDVSWGKRSGPPDGKRSGPLDSKRSGPPDGKRSGLFDDKHNKSYEENISGDSATILLFVNILNIVIEFVVINYSNEIGMLVLVLIMVVPLLLQLTIALLVFLYRHITYCF